MGKVEIHMPKMGATMEAGKLISWLKQEGDFLKEGEPIAEIESEKITNEVKAPETGVIESIRIQEGETVKIGTVLAIIDTSRTNNEHEKKEVKQEENYSKIEDKSSDKYRKIKDVRQLSTLRKTIGKRMKKSMNRSPQGTLTTKADMTGLNNLKERFNNKGNKISYTSLFIKIISLALTEDLRLNSTIKQDKLIIYDSINIGVAVAAENGLYVPVIKQTQEKDIIVIERELGKFVEKVRRGTLSVEDMEGGTFTISNLGMYDVNVHTPIINPPEAAILGIGCTKKELVVNNDESTEIKPLVTFSLTADHMITDAVQIVKFFKNVKKIMKSPEKYLD